MQGTELKKLMKKDRLSRNQLAQLIGFSYDAVATWEREGTTPAMERYIKRQMGW